MDVMVAPQMKRMLEERRATLLAEGPVPVKVERGEVLASATDEDEAPYLEMGQAIASARNRERDRQIAALDDALRRLAEDVDAFGVCEGCGEEIPLKRLALVPWARRCVACQQEGDEPIHGGSRRRVTDYR